MSELKERVKALCGKSVLSCYQCGMCSATCPFVEHMDILPHQAIRLLQLGREEVLNSKTIWLCVSCMACSDKCPRGVGPAFFLEALRQVVLRKGVDKVRMKEVPRLEELPPLALVTASRKFTG